MSLFDKLVSRALQNQGALAPLRPVVEKELLHHDILREMSMAGLLKNLTFIGGTCLRACYGSSRLSEDLDFSGGHDFKRQNLDRLSDTLKERFLAKYDLQVEVSEPATTGRNVDTWKLRIITHPRTRNLADQRIHIDICALPSYDRQPMMLRNHYGIEMGTSGLIIQAQSREEILVDKLVALALRPNRIKNRDLWDIGWLKQQNISQPLSLLNRKISDRHLTSEDFLENLQQRDHLLNTEPQLQEDFLQEMRRFLPPEVVAETVARDPFWQYLTGLVHAEVQLVLQHLTGAQEEGLV